MTKVYILYNEKKNIFRTFTKYREADAWNRVMYDNVCTIKESELIMKIDASGYINWNDVPKAYNFIYRDTTGLFACFYKPTKEKYFESYGGKTRWKRYGGERYELEYKKYHDFIIVGDVFERPFGRNDYFIKWKSIPKAHFIKYVNDAKENIDIFDCDGNLLYSGSNKDIGIIDVSKTYIFDGFNPNTYTFEK